MPKGRMTTVNIGVTMMITSNVLTTTKRVARKELSTLGMSSSMTYMSLEKRLRTRPSGVVSKKDMGDLRMFLSIRACRVREALIPAMARNKVFMRMSTTLPAPRIA